MTATTVLVWIILCGGLGGAIGATKNRLPAGIILGILFGPIGVIIVACLPKIAK